MLRGAPPAAGPTGTVGRARAAPELHGAVPSGTAGCGLNRDHGPCTSRGSYASTHAHLGTAGRETLWGPRAVNGPEELRDSERSHGCRRDAVTVCFQYLVPQVTVSDDSTFCSELVLLHSELGVATRILPFELWPRVLKQTARKLVSLVTSQIVCGSRWHSLFRRQSTQQQEQCAGSPRVKILYPKHTV
jgi:hypothetical protein